MQANLMQGQPHAAPANFDREFSEFLGEGYYPNGNGDENSNGNGDDENTGEEENAGLGDEDDNMGDQAGEAVASG